MQENPLIAESIKHEKYRFHIANSHTYQIAAIAHFFFILLFYYLDVFPLVFFNIFSVFIFVISYKFCIKKKEKTASLLAISEITLHAAVATYYVGWETGYFYYLLGAAPLISYSSETTKIQKIIQHFILALIFVAIKYYADTHSAIYALDSQVTQFLYYSNGFTFILLLGFVSYSYSFTAKASEDKILLEQQKADLANQSKSMFLANMSHEIRTPMNGMLSLVQVLQTTKLDEQQHEYLKSIGRAGSTLIRLIDDLLDLSRIESGKLEINEKEFILWEFIDDVLLQVEYLFDDKDIHFNVDVNDNLPSALISDDVRLKQVIVNLINNAIKFTEKGEVNLIITGKEAGDNIYCLQIEVNDTGMGIPEDKLESIFKPFQQISPDRIHNKGVGLGLPICKKIINALKGKIRIQSAVGKGTNITLDFVFPLGKGKEKTGNKEIKNIDLSPLKILLVEDDEISRLAVNTWLKGKHHTVIVAENGQKAVDYLRENKVDVVLMDVHMPVMGGVAATKIIKAENLSTAPIVGMTASVMNEERKSYISAGMDVLVEKPVNFESLMRIVKEKLQK